MRFLVLSVILLLSTVKFAPAQMIDINEKAVGKPMYRPALIGKSPQALINRINTADLVKKGQKDGAIMFMCLVKQTGEVSEGLTYRGTPESEALEEELKKKLTDTKFIPAVYNHLPVDAVYYGTVVFTIVNEKPRLRIFSNQEIEEVKKENDFIGPQPFYGNGSKFTGAHYPGGENAVMVNGVVQLQLKVDATGNLQSSDVVSEDPPLRGFGLQAKADYVGAKFIPAFRNGKAVESEVTLPIFYQAK